MTIEGTKYKDEKMQANHREWSKAYYDKNKFEVNKRRAIKRMEMGKTVSAAIKAYYGL